MESTFFEKISIISIYSAASVATFDLNKYIMRNMKFNMPYLLVIIQCVIIVYIIFVQSLFTKIKIRFSKHTKWYFISLLLTAMMLTGMKAIYYFQPTVFTLYKNTSIIFTALAELYFFDRKITWIAILSFVVMIASSLIGDTNKEVEFVGYVWMLANILSTTAFVIHLKKLMAIDLSTRQESVLFTNLLSVPYTIILSLLFDEFNFPPISFKLVLLILCSGITAYFTSFSTAWAMRVLSSTSYSMIGALNKLALSATGFMIFNEEYKQEKIISLFVGILASLIYSFDSSKTPPISQAPQKLLDTHETR